MNFISIVNKLNIKVVSTALPDLNSALKRCRSIDVKAISIDVSYEKPLQASMFLHFYSTVNDLNLTPTDTYVMYLYINKSKNINLLAAPLGHTN